MKHPSSNTTPTKSSRREFLSQSGKVATGAALAGVAIPAVHPGENNTIQLALIGCGGRGGGAVANAMASAHGPVKLVAMADIVESRIDRALNALSSQYSDRIDVPKERQFVGF